MKKLILAAACSLALTSMGTLAATGDAQSFGYRAGNTPVNYNYGEVSFGKQHFTDDGGIDLDSADLLGFGMGALFNQHWVFEANYEHGKISDSRFKYTAQELKATLGYRFAVMDSTDLVVGAGFLYDDEDVHGPMVGEIGGDEQSEVGYEIYSGLRHGISERGEAGIKLEVQRIYDDTVGVLTADSTYYFNDNFGVGVRVGYQKGSDDLDSYNYGAFARFKF